jgi:hypothetical protein
MKEAIAETRPLVLDRLFKIEGNFYVVTEWTPLSMSKARKEVDITSATAELRQELRKMRDQGRKPIDFGLKVRAHPDALMVTAQNKMRTSILIKRVVPRRSKSLTPSDRPFVSVRGCGPKPPPCSPLFAAGGARYFSGRAKSP